jgi:hypothetical protein
MGTDIDALAIGNYLLLKSRQSSLSADTGHHQQFLPDYESVGKPDATKHISGSQQASYSV